MDFWASLEHKIYYKYNKEVPQRMLDELRETAEMATLLDKKMENLHKEMEEMKQTEDAQGILQSFGIGNNKLKLFTEE